MTKYTTSIIFDADGEVERASKFKSILRTLRRLDPNIRVYEAEELDP